MTLLSLDAVTKRYGEAIAVNSLTLQVEKGDVLCLLGPNGAGKTTTLKMVLGLEPPTEGIIMVGGSDVVADPRGARRRMAYIPEVVALHETFTGFENLRYFTSLITGADLSVQHLESCLSQAGLQENAWHQRLSGYSKGMRQKVGVAIAIAKGAELLVLDEPTSGLDPKSAFDFANLVRALASGGAGVIMATHDLFRAKDMGTRIIILNRGEAVQSIDPAHLSYGDIEDAYLSIFENV